MENTLQERKKAIIGELEGDFWIYDSETGFDLTRSDPRDLESPQNAVTFKTSTSKITVDPTTCALVIIDMQNFFLSPALGRPVGSKGLAAEAQLLKYAIPAAREAGIQIIYVNWGLTDDDLRAMSPAQHRTFSFNMMAINDFQKLIAPSSNGSSANPSAPKAKLYNNAGQRSLGQTLEEVTLEDGSTVSAGRKLMRGDWNAQLSPALLASFQASKESKKPDVLLDKTRMSGLHEPSVPLAKYLSENKLRTLFLAGVNTDQCVNGTLADAYMQGYDVVMLRDACATTSPQGAQECVEYNVEIMGFVLDCPEFARGCSTIK